MHIRYYLLSALFVIFLVKPIKFLVHFYYEKKRIKKCFKNIESVDDYPLIGCALRFVGKNNMEIFDLLKKEIGQRTEPFYGWLGNKCFIIVDKPEDIQVVTTSKNCIEKSDVYRFFNRGVGLFAAPASKWRPQRKQLSTSFNPNFIQSFLPIFNEKTDWLVRNVGQMIGKGDFDLKPIASDCTLDIVCETVMGVRTNIQNGEPSDYSESLTNLLAVITRRIVNVFLHPDIIYKHTHLYKLECKYLARTEAFTQKLIDQKRHAFGNNNDSLPESDQLDCELDKPQEKPQIFIDRLLSLHKQGLVTEKEIKDQVNLVVFGGNDTSAHAASLVILMLAIYPHYQDLAIEELNGIFGDLPVDCPITMEHINQMNFLEQIFRESVRLFGSAFLLGRHCTAPTQISNCTIPAGIEVILSVATAHRRKDVWGDDADEFNPDHFASEQMSKRNPFAYMVFSQGPRNCIGIRFAYISIKLMLAKLLRKYRFKTKIKFDDIKMRMEITSKLIPGAIVSVEDRLEKDLN